MYLKIYFNVVLTCAVTFFCWMIMGSFLAEWMKLSSCRLCICLVLLDTLRFPCTSSVNEIIWCCVLAGSSRDIVLIHVLWNPACSVIESSMFCVLTRSPILHLLSCSYFHSSSPVILKWLYVNSQLIPQVHWLPACSVIESNVLCIHAHWVSSSLAT